jgi:Caudovirus prohead serine protease
MTKQMQTENNKIIQRDVAFKVRELTTEMIAAREAEFVISSEAVDTYGTVFMADGADFTRYNMNPIVAYAHEACSDDPDMILGTSEVRQEKKLTIGKVRFEDEETNPMAEKIWKKIVAGTIRMASIGARVIEWRWGDETKGEDKNVIYFTRWELLEWSIVPIGSNPDALLRNAQTVEEIRKALENKPGTDGSSGTETRKLSVRKAKYLYNQNNF